MFYAKSKLIHVTQNINNLLYKLLVNPFKSTVKENDYIDAFFLNTNMIIIR